MTLATRLRRLTADVERLEAAHEPPRQLDPLELARCAGLELDRWQEDLLRSTAPRALVNVTRQGGKTAATSVLAVHAALSAPEQLILLFSPSQRQSSELFRACLRVYRAAGRPVASDAETLLRLELANGSRILSLPGKEGTIRGFSGPALVAIDEASRVDDEMLTAISPMFARRSRVSASAAGGGAPGTRAATCGSGCACPPPTFPVSRLTSSPASVAS
jgi:hypothetical protein